MSYELEFASLAPYLEVLIAGLWLTIKLTAITTVLGILVGIVCAVGRASTSKALRAMTGVYVEVVRNTPFLVQLFFIFFGLPSIGVQLSAVEAAILALTLNLGAYATEIVRAGIEAIHRGQIEAGESLGMSRYQIYRHIILVPAIEKVYPALASQCIIVMLGSAVVSQISAEELTFAANYIQSRTFRGFEVYLLVTLMYLGLAVGMRQVFRLVGWYAFPRRRRAGGRA